MGFLSSLFRKAPSRDLFKRQMVIELNQLGAKPQAVADAFEIKLSHGLLRLEKLYLCYCQSASGDRANQLKALARSALRTVIPAEFDEARSQLLPIIRHRSQLDKARLIHLMQFGAEEDPTHCARVFCESLEIGLAIDGPVNISRVQASNLQQWDMEFDAALAVAMDNLAARSPPKWREISPGVFISSWNDDYDSSRILLPDLIGQLLLAGPPIAIIASRGHVYVAGRDQPNVYERLAELVEHSHATATHAIGAELLQLVDGVWQTLSVDEDCLECRALGRLQHTIAVSDYASQKELLDKAYNQAGRDLFVASVLTLNGPAGALITACSWTRGVDTLLPRTDLVVMLAAPDDAGTATIHRWKDIEAYLGSYMTSTEHTPPRYHVSEFPGDAELAAVPLRPSR